MTGHTAHLFYAPELALTAELPEEESHHCCRVLRLKEGDEISVTDGKGMSCRAILTEMHPKRCVVRITEKRNETPAWNVYIHLAVAPTKHTDRMEWFVEKATEIGINEITCLRCRRSERREINLRRLSRIAVNAMKQSQKTFLPQINGMKDFRDFITADFDGDKMIGHCDREAPPGEVLKQRYQAGRNALLLIGPEGDFSREEIRAALAAGFVPVSFGESRLRTETAALVACHTIHVLNV
jgi:16S rRNA (uracil1498-N3)-methyltransferase